MGSHQSRPSDDQKDGYVTVTRQVAKRASMNLLKKVDSKQNALPRSGQHALSPASCLSPTSTVASPSILRRYSPIKSILASKSSQPFFSDQRHVQVNGRTGQASIIPRDTTSSTLVPSKIRQSTTNTSSAYSEITVGSAADETPPASAGDAFLNIIGRRPVSSSHSVPLASDDEHNDGAIHPVHRRCNTIGPDISSDIPMPCEPPRLGTMTSVSAPNLLMADFPTPSISLHQTSPEKPYRPASKLAPSHFFHQAIRVLHPHAPRTIKSADPRVLRMVQQRYPLNLVRELDTTAAEKIGIALAMPLTRSQTECHGQHATWLSSDNCLAPVECAVCLGPRDIEGLAQAYRAWMCEYCALRVCPDCKNAVDENGLAGLKERYDDGSDRQGDGRDGVESLTDTPTKG